MYSIDEIIEQIDQDSEVEDNLDAARENEDTTEGNADETKKDDDTNADSTKVQPKVKRKQADRPKLDFERLKGPRGLICMEKMFSDLKFKGNGYEKQDLNQVMNMLQYWCHRLFPKFTFDDCLAQLEKLGTKKPVITLKKKIIFDMIEEDTPIDPNNLEDDDTVDVTDSQQEVMNDFDMLLNQEPMRTSLTTSQPAVTAEVVQLTNDQKEMIEKNRQLATERRRARLEAMKQKELENSERESTQNSQAENSQTLSLTEEQKLIIEKNRLLAIERRKRLQNKSNVSSELSQITEENLCSNTTQEVDSTTKSTEQEIMSEELRNESQMQVNVFENTPNITQELNSTTKSTEQEISEEVRNESEMHVNDTENLNRHTAQIHECTKKSSEQDNLSKELRNELEMQVDVSENTEENLIPYATQVDKNSLKPTEQDNLSEKFRNESEMQVDVSENIEENLIKNTTLTVDENTEKNGEQDKGLRNELEMEADDF